MFLALSAAVSAVPVDGCEQNWVFQVSTGRSGSTSLMEMVNDLPGAYMAGENSGMFGSLYQLHIDSIQTNSHQRQAGDHAWWHRQIDQNELKKLSRAYLAAAIGLNDAIAYSLVGFKEIRWSGPAELDFLMSLFPCAKVLVNIRRDVVAQSSSGMWKTTNRSSASLANMNELLETWQKLHQTRTKLLTTKELTCSHMNDVYAWLGFPHCKCLRMAHANNHNGFKPDMGPFARCSVLRAQDE
jgi:hypothetical protein